MTAIRTTTGKPRATPRNGNEVHQHEIEPGRAVQNDWDKALFEPWSARKARLASARAERNDPMTVARARHCAIGAHVWWSGACRHCGASRERTAG